VPDKMPDGGSKDFGFADPVSAANASPNGEEDESRAVFFGWRYLVLCLWGGGVCDGTVGGTNACVFHIVVAVHKNNKEVVLNMRRMNGLLEFIRLVWRLGSILFRRVR